MITKVGTSAEGILYCATCKECLWVKYRLRYVVYCLMIKVIAAEGEQKASRALREASEVIGDSPAALQLRYLQVCASFGSEILNIAQVSAHYASVTCCLACKVKQKSIPGILKWFVTNFVMFCRLWTPSRQRRIPQLYFLYLLTFSPTSWRLKKLCPNSRYIILSYQYW